MFVFFPHLFRTSSSLDVPTGVTQEEGHTGFLIHLPSAAHAIIFIARRIQPFLSLVDREVEFCVLTNSPLVGHIYIYFSSTALHLCIVITYSRVWINQVVLRPARGQLAQQGNKICPCPRLRLRIWSRDGFGRSVTRQPAHSPRSR